MYSLETGLWIQVKYLNGIVWSREVHLKWLICKWSDFLGVWLAYVLESQVEACLQMDLREIWVGFCRCPFYLMQQIKGFLYPVWSSPHAFFINFNKPLRLSKNNRIYTDIKLYTVTEQVSFEVLQLVAYYFTLGGQTAKSRKNAWHIFFRFF